MDPSTLVPLLYLLPPEWQHAVTTALLFLGSMTVLVAALKSVVPGLRALAERTASTRDDRAVSIVADVLGDLARLAEWCQRVTEVMAGHRAPPVRAILSAVKRKGPPVAAVLLFALTVHGAGCVGSSVRTHATIADSAYEPILAAKLAIEDHAYRAVALIKEDSATPEEAEARISRLRPKYAKVEGAMALVIEAYNSYVDAIQAAHGDGKDVRTEAGLALLNRWKSLLSAAEQLGLDLPEPPAALRGLVP